MFFTALEKIILYWLFLTIHNVSYYLLYNCLYFVYLYKIFLVYFYIYTKKYSSNELNFNKTCKNAVLFELQIQKVQN